MLNAGNSDPELIWYEIKKCVGSLNFLVSVLHKKTPEGSPVLLKHIYMYPGSAVEHWKLKYHYNAIPPPSECGLFIMVLLGLNEPFDEISCMLLWLGDWIEDPESPVIRRILDAYHLGFKENIYLTLGAGDPSIWQTNCGVLAPKCSETAECCLIPPQSHFFSFEEQQATDCLMM